MLKRSRLVPSLLLICVAASPSFSSPPIDVPVYEKTAVDRFAVTARGLALGRTGVALSDNPNALVLNPAALPTLRRSGLHLMASSLASGSRYYSLAYTGRPQRLGSLSVAHVLLDSGDISGRAGEMAQPYSYKVSDQSTVLGYARNIWPRAGLMAGTALRFRQQRVGTVAGTGFGLDGGLFRQFAVAPRHRLNVGGVYQDAVPMKLRLEGAALSRKVLRGGLGYEWGWDYRSLPSRVTLGWDVSRDARGSLAHAFGAECDIGFFSLRGGYREDNLGFGLGTQLARSGQTFLIDYGILEQGFAQSHTFSLSWLLGNPEDAVRPVSAKPPLFKRIFQWWKSSQGEGGWR